MFHTTKLYYFSPTGGTRKCGELFCEAISEKVTSINLGAKEPLDVQEGRNQSGQNGLDENELIVFALPVFSGRIPALAADKLKGLDGSGRRAVTMAVYGNRDYEDALLELNDIAADRGFHVVASCACVAQHSIAPEVGKGRPDENDSAWIRDFAKRVEKKIESGGGDEFTVPGNRPYRDGPGKSVAPISLPACGMCGACAEACPVNAISFEADTVVTDPEKCIQCMACTAVCPQNVRILPPPVKEMIEQMLGAFKAIRRENEAFL